ncbi:MAG: riboflavin synthase [Lentisphaeria bacterium]
MFTGIIEDLGTVVKITGQGNAARLEVRTGLPAKEIALGDSIAVNGVCQTVAEFHPPVLTFHALQETLQKSNLRHLQVGMEVNLESALRLGGKLGGHLVSGHVDCTGQVMSISDRAGDIALKIARPMGDFPLVNKGSIAINGVSLTVAELTAEAVLVCIIPHTWKYTNLRLLQPGEEVNLEADLIGKYVQSLSGPYSSKKSLTLDDLSQAGFGV